MLNFQGTVYIRNGITYSLPLIGGSIFLVNPGSVLIINQHQPAEFLPGQRPDFRSVAGPLELSVIQALLQEHKSIPVEVERFHRIFFAPTEQKDCIGERVHLEVIPDDCHESIKGFPHICSARNQIDFLYSGQIADQSSRRADIV